MFLPAALAAACVPPGIPEKTDSGAGCGDTHTSPQDCGTCGHSCLGGECKQGKCQPFLLALQGRALDSIATDGLEVFWTTGTTPDGAVYKAPASGGPVSAIAVGLNNPRALSLVAGYAFWASYDAGTVWSAPKTGGALTVIVKGGSGSIGRCPAANELPCGPSGLALSQTHVYWSNENATASGSASHHAVSRIEHDNDKSVGAITPIALGSAVGGGIDGRVDGVAYDGTRVYVAVFGSATILSFPADGSSPKMGAVVASGTGGARHLALFGDELFWTSYDDGTVRKAPKAGGKTTTLASGDPGANRIAVDASGVYWQNSKTGLIQRVDVAGGSVEVIAAQVDATRPIAALALDKDAVYFGINADPAAIYKIAK